MNREPNQNSREPRRNPNLTEEQLRARRAATKRAYYEKKRKEKQRARMLFGIACAVVAALLIGIVILIVRGIGALTGGEDTTTTQGADSGIAQGTDVQSTDNGSTPPFTESEEQTGSAETGDGTTEVVTEAVPTYEELAFKADLRDYEKYMDPKEDPNGYLILVNADHALTKDDTPTDLIDVTNTRLDGRDKQKMRRTAAKALEALYMEAHAQGIIRADTPSGYPLSVTSAYRDYATQNYLFNQYTKNEMSKNPSLTQAQAEAIVETYSCRPGTSEHQTGLCCDMHTLSGADVSFKNDPASDWLAENAWKFGFILRFPADKTDVTGISYEPWHFRYVGRYHAYQMYQSGMCLEEYVASLG